MMRVRSEGEGRTVPSGALPVDRAGGESASDAATAHRRVQLEAAGGGLREEVRGGSERRVERRGAWRQREAEGEKRCVEAAGGGLREEVRVSQRRKGVRGRNKKKGCNGQREPSIVSLLYRKARTLSLRRFESG